MNFYRLYDNSIDYLQEEVYLNACKAVQIALHNHHLAVFEYIESKKSHFELKEVLTDIDCQVLSQMPEQVREILGYINGGPFKWADFDLILIYLADAGRNRDGSFQQGALIPLIVYNSVDEHISWTFNGNPIAPGPDGLWAIPGDGTLKAEIFNKDGSKDVIVKEIRIK